jgi:predicted regulator of Ras-like GTPase activity (Roadblock/LC7/MglB family)
MANLNAIASLPDVGSAVLGDLEGGLVDAVRESDGETVAAVMGFVASHLIEAGDHLGLGPLQSAAVAGPVGGRVIAVHAGAVIAAVVPSVRSLAAVERAIEASLRDGS